MTAVTATKPHWPDVCGHDRPLDRFLGTFKFRLKTYDVFVYQDNALNAAKPDMHVCIRYGLEGGQYISPGNAADFVKRVSTEQPRYLDGGKADWPDSYRLALPLVEAWLKEQTNA